MRSWRVRAMIAAGISVVGYGLLIPRERTRAHWSEWQWQGQPEILAAVRVRRPLSERAEELQARLEAVEARELIRQVPTKSGLVVIAGAGVSTIAHDRVEAATRAELASLGLTTPKHPIVVRVDMDTARANYSSFSRLVVFPRASDEACGVIVRVAPRFHGRFGISQVLGPCQYAAKFGAPGDGVRRWMRETRMASAGDPAVALWYGPSDTVEFSHVGPNRWAYEGCRAGSASACARVFTPRRLEMEEGEFDLPSEYRDALWEHGDVWGNRSSSPAPRSWPVTVGLLAALADELGARRFAEIWASDLPPAEAYERIEGRPISDWVSERLSKYMPPYRRGPGPGGLQLGLAILLTVLAVATTVRFSKRRMS